VPKEVKQSVRAPSWMGTKGSLIWKLLPKIARTQVGKLILQTIARFTIESSKRTYVNNTEFVLCNANPRLDSRVRTFTTKEPETLKWIDSFKHGSVLWDIGANIGLYSLYAAKTRDCEVFAFEPSVFCLEFLSRNIWLNDLQSQITIVPNPLSDKTQLNLLTLHSREWGESSNSFGTSLNQDGKEIDASFDYSILGVTIDEAISKLNLPVPQHIKIDVDGIEPLILAGGTQTLKRVESVSVEVPTYRGANERVSELLSQAGLKLVLDSGNQIWRRV
jgi:FkbM family methyltransferase